MPVTRAEAMTVPVFAKARHVVVSPARLPFAAVNAAGVLDAQPLIIAQPNPAERRATTLTWTLDDLLWHGLSWWAVTSRYATGFPRTAERVDPLFVDVDDDGRVWIDGTGPWDDGDVIRIDGPHEGLLSFGACAIRKAARIEAAAARTADNPVPLIELHNTGPDLDDAEIDETASRVEQLR